MKNYKYLLKCRYCWLNLFLFFLGGAILLSIFSGLQKILIGFQLHPKGFIIPVLFGGLTGVIIGIEIHKLKTYSAALKNTHMLLDSIVESMPSTLIAFDSSDKITYWNKTAEIQTGIKPEDLIGLHFEKAIKSFNIDPDTLISKIRSRKVEKWTENKKKKESDFSSQTITVYPLNSEAEEGSVLMITDTTREYKMEKQLEHSRKMEMVGQLAEGVAHDFNNMLGVIIGATELLKSSEQKFDKDNRELLEMIQNSSETAANLASKLLSLGKNNETGFRIININELLRESVDILKHTTNLGIISITYRADSNKIKGDFSALQSAIINLGINSYHAIKKTGKINISAENVYIDDSQASHSLYNINPGRFIKIIFTDNGCGIPKDVIEYIFDPFFTTKKKENGTGLGLTAVYETVVNHHGFMDVESRIKEGTSFYIYLPCAE